MKGLRRILEWIAFVVLRALVRRLPRSAARRLGTLVGRFAFDALRLRRSVAIENVRARLEPSGGIREAERIARASFEFLGRTFVDLLRFDRREDESFWNSIDAAELKRVAASFPSSGVVFVSGHFGNWELLLRVASRLGVNVAALAGDQANVRVDRAVKALRAKASVTTLSARKEVRRAIRFLRSGGWVSTLMDQDARRKGVFLEFLGTPASTHVGIVRLALHSGAPLIPVALVETGDTHRLILGEAWTARPGASEDESAVQGAQEFTRFLEREVRLRPEQYMWAHRRWKTRPLP